MSGEEWRPAIGMSDSHQVSSLGRVKSIARRVPCAGGGTRMLPERLMKPRLNEYGYLFVNMSSKNSRRTAFVHVLVAEAFIGPKPDGLQVDHINHDKTDNRLENLRYCNAETNSRRRLSNKLTEADVRQISEMLKGDLTHKQIADIYNVSRENISMIFRGETWKGVTK